MANLIGVKKMVKLSVYCLAYNHEKYIRDALEGFVNQITNFEFEVIVHDDASTDNTAKIIREYEDKYPNIIKPIYEKENQYSKGVNISKTICFPKMKGEYIAICEGDDYWCDRNKLQKQVDFLDANIDFSACAHCAKVLNCIDGTCEIFNKVENDYIMPIQDIIEWKDKKFLTASVVMRREYFVFPEKLNMGNVGDCPRALNLVINGKIMYFSDVMSVYRMYSSNSWTRNMLFNVDKFANHVEDYVKCMTNFDEMTNQKYHDAVDKSIRRKKCELYLEAGDYPKFKKISKDIFDNFLKRQILLCWVMYYFPWAYKTYKRIRNFSNVV